MTPSATTPAARRARGQGSTVPGHRKTVRPKPAPRRVSGPIGGRTAAAPLPRPARRAAATQPLVDRLIARVRALPDHQLLDRVVRGRAWILILGVMLAGIVAMQVEVLKLGASIGRSIERGSALQSRNELLRESVAALADQQRIERLASGMGMVMPPPGGVGFLKARDRNFGRAAGAIKAPDAAAFTSLLSSNGAIATSLTPGSSSSPSTSALSSTTAGSVGSSVSGVQGSTAGTSGISGSTAGTPGTSATTSTGASASTTTGTVSGAAMPSAGTTQSQTQGVTATSASSSGGASMTGG